MARKRAYKKRADYRKGGRVQYYNGGLDEGGGMIDPVTGDPIPGSYKPLPGTGGTGDTGGGGDTTIPPSSGLTAAQQADYDAVANIPVTGNYTADQVALVEKAISSGAMSNASAAKMFGATEDQVSKERERIEQVKKTGTTDIADPYADAPLPNVVEQQKQAAAVSNIPADGKYTAAETQSVVDALNSGAMTSQQAADQFGTTVAQVEAELKRQNEVADPEGTGTTDILDPFAGGVQAATRPELLRRAAEDQLKDIDLRKIDDPSTKTDESKDRVPGAIAKDYKRIDPNLLFDDRTATTIDPSTGISADTDIKKLDAYTDLKAPTGVDDNDFKVVTGVVTKALKAGTITPDTYNAAVVNILNSPQFAQNRNRPPISVDELPSLSERTQAAQISGAEKQAGQAQRVTDDFISDDSSVKAVDFRKAVNISPTKEAEKQTRNNIVTDTPASREAAKILEADNTKIDYESFKRNEVKGTAQTDAAITFVAETSNLPPTLAKKLVEDPATVTAQLDNEAPEVVFAAAALPTEALVSSQMETLLAGMESGNIPTWARPAYDAVNQNMTQRGIDASTVGRDALFNAIIQSAIPIAQSNAQALQARAAQNLSNEQQGKLQQAQLDSTRRMNNLANRQTSESQSAQFAQNLNVLQSQFDQERDILSAQQQQQTRVQNLQNQQRTAELNNQAQNTLKAQSLGNEQQMELANLEIKNQTEQANFTAENQERLAEMQVAADFLSKNQNFVQQMELANLNSDQQMRLANLTAKNQASSEELTAAQQTELANLNARMQTNITQGRIAESMGVALLNADQQRAVQNATTIARMDLTKFNDAQQVELANSKFMQTVSLSDFNARQQAVMQDATALAGLDMATADQNTKLAIAQAQNFLQRDMADLSNEQQALILDTQVEQQRLLSDQAATNAAKQFNATSTNQINQFVTNLAAQIDQFNNAQSNAMEQFNKTEENRVGAINAANAIDAAKFNNQLKTQLAEFNEQMDLQRDQWNAANAQAVEQSNVTWRRQANTINTAAQNAANQENAAKSFQISAADQSFIWQALRDEAAYLRQGYENHEQRKTTLYATAISNDIDTGAVGLQPIVDIVDGIID